MSDDIVDTLRRNPLYIPSSRINSFGRPQMGFELTSFNLIAADEIERLRKERDSMRRIWCEDTFKVGKSYRCDADGNPVLCKSPQEIAEGFEWDCFKENP